MSKTKNVGIFSVLLFGVMMLLIPATSIADAAEYDRYYQEKKDRYSIDYGYENERYYDDYRQTSYDNENKKVDKKESDRPVIIVKNKIPIPHQEKEKKKEPPMLIVKKEVLFCDDIANDNEQFCETDLPFGAPLPPNSNRWVEQCNSEVCEGVDESTFNIKVVNGKEFEGSEKGTKLNLEVGRFMVTEDRDALSDLAFAGIAEPEVPFSIDQACKNSGYDGSLIQVSGFEPPNFGLEGLVTSCVLFEGDCSGNIHYGEQKECIVKNYITSANTNINPQ